MEYVDEHPVVDHQVRFIDRAPITDGEAEYVKDGQVVVWLVQARCQPPSYHPIKPESEERYRFNVQKVERVAVLTGDLRQSAVQYLNDPDQRQGYLAFEAPRFPDTPTKNDTPKVDQEPEASLDDPAPYAWEYVQSSLDDAGVEVVGSVYRGPESETQRLLRETWGEQ